MFLNDYDIDWDDWRIRHKPFGISGCIRVRNESQFMVPSILSHLPYLDECVIVTQPSDDNTVELAEHLASSLKKVQHYHYPYVVDWIDTPGFYEKDPNQPGHLVHMSNWALSKCTYSWISKTEGDVLCLSSYQRIVDAIRANPNRSFYYGRLILNMAGENCDMISVQNPTNGGMDECTMNNDPSRYKFIRSGKWETIPSGHPAECYGLSMLHLKRCKTGKTEGWNGEHYAPFTKDMVDRLIPQWMWQVEALWDEIQEVLESVR